MMWDIILYILIGMVIQSSIDQIFRWHKKRRKGDTWEGNVANCELDEELSVLISDLSPYDHASHVAYAVKIIHELNLQDTKFSIGQTGHWCWFTFEDTADAVAFKLRWL